MAATLNVNDTFTATYNGKARYARVLESLKGGECVRCEILDDDGNPVPNTFRNFTVSGLDNLRKM